MFDDLMEETPKPSKGARAAKPAPKDDTVDKLLSTIANMQAQIQALQNKPQTIEVNTPAPVVQDVNMIRAMQTERVQKRYRNFNNTMLQAKRTKVRIPKAYKRFFGNYIVSSINGNTVSVPIDGAEHEVTLYHYDDILNKMAGVDDLYVRQGSDVIQQDRQGTI